MKRNPDMYANLGPCIPWRNKKTGEAGTGYGTLKHEGRWAPAHRVVYCRTYGVTQQELWDRKLVIRHKCDNKACINPDHLEEGTQKENMKDIVRRGYHFTQINPRPRGVSVSFSVDVRQTERVEKHRQFLTTVMRQDMATAAVVRGLLAHGLEIVESEE